jgi:predicted short-subunit dehydrogenase-like oxidoreductase (DUF2520 family)
MKVKEMDSPTIALVGAGNLATQAGKNLLQKGYRTVQVFSRTAASAQALATVLQCSATCQPEEITTEADIYLFALSDGALASVLERTPANGGIWLHTSGSVPMEIFAPYTQRYGVFYPFQTFSKERDVSFERIPVLLQASDSCTMEAIRALACSVSGYVLEVSQQQRECLHLSGVFACNFVNCLYSISQQILQRANLPFDLLYPLIDETAEKIHRLSPQAAQTGPAIRHDRQTIERHLRLLSDEGDLLNLYTLLSELIEKTALQASVSHK